MNQDLLISGLTAFASGLLVLRILVPVAHHIGLLDHPGANKVHDAPTALVGGIAIFIAFAFAVLTSDVPLSSYRLLFAGSLILVVVGVLDDFHELCAMQRFGAQIAASLMVALGAGVVINDFGHLVWPDWLLSLGNLAVPVTVFSTVGVINALNMSDGLDGLAGSLVLVTVGALGVAAWAGGETEAVRVLVLLATVVLAFLAFNLRPGGKALVFLGDAGSMFLGFVLAWFLIRFSQGESRLLDPVTALWIFALPLVDTVSMTLRRIIRGRSPFLGDREHFHHMLLAAGFSPMQTLAVMVSLALAAAGVGLAGQFLGIAEHWMFLGFLALFVLHFQIVARSWRDSRFLNRPLLQRYANPGGTAD